MTKSMSNKYQLTFQGFKKYVWKITTNVNISKYFTSAKA